MKLILFPILVLTALITVALETNSWGAPANTTCPVTTDEESDPSIFTTYHDQRVQFCCQRCKKQFLEDPQKYTGNLPPDFFEQTLGNATEQADHEHAVTDGSAENSHDHATDHGEQNIAGRMVRFVGKFHPVAVHFPIALLLAAVLAEALHLFTGRQPFSHAAHFSIRLGALSALVAVALGLSAGSFASYPGDLANILVVHRWMGITTAGMASIAAIASIRAVRKTATSRDVALYRAALFLSATLVGGTGHLGAMLIYGFDHFTW